MASSCWSRRNWATPIRSAGTAAQGEFRCGERFGSLQRSGIYVRRISAFSPLCSIRTSRRSFAFLHGYRQTLSIGWVSGNRGATRSRRTHSFSLTRSSLRA
jgi:hypothetical protein